jgi:hypothetical protein
VQVPPEVAETLAERKKRLMFEQKNILESLLIEKSLRGMRAEQLAAKSRRQAKKNAQFKPAAIFPDAARADTWGSIDAKEIRLRREVIAQIYSTNTRGIRCYQKWRPLFYGQTVSDQFERMEKEVKEREKVVKEVASSVA